MSSKRKLKKDINETIDLLYTDCIFYKTFVIDADAEAADKVMMSISEVQDEFLKRINANEGKQVDGRVKAYYRKLKADFKEEINKIAKEIEALG